MNETIQMLYEWLTLYGLSVLGALIILLVGARVAKWLGRVSQRLMSKASVDPTLVSFAGAAIRVVILIFVVIAALNQLGVQTTSLIAVLGAAGLAVGLALQGNLANLAAGILILIFRPFHVGDFVEAGGTLGTVEAISILNTKLKAPDGVLRILPNTKVLGDTISNYNTHPIRRIDLVVGIGYGDDIGVARGAIADVLAADPRVLDDPAPRIDVLELADSSVNLAVRPWVAREVYWDTRCQLLEGIKLALDRAGVNIPYPQRDVHLIPSAGEDTAD